MGNGRSEGAYCARLIIFRRKIELFYPTKYIIHDVLAIFSGFVKRGGSFQREARSMSDF